jgi:hypothetical protein
VNPRLLIDSFRRNWASLVIQGLMGAAIWIATGAGLFSTGTAIAASMALAQLSGPVLAVRMVAPREVLILPMSKAEIWRTRFVFSTIIVVVAVASGKLLAFAVSPLWLQPAPGLDTIALSTVLDIVYASVFTWLFFIIPAQRSTLMAIGVGVFLLSPFLPFVFADRLPTTWSQLTTGSISLMIAGVIAGVLAFAGTPLQVTAPGPAAGRAALKARGRGWWPEFPRVVGLNRLLMKTWTTALAIQVGTIVVVPVGMTLVDRLFDGSVDDLSTAAREFGLFPFEPDANTISAIWMWIFASVGNESMTTMLRHLRSLPLRAWSLAVVFLAGSLVTWINAWIVLSVFHFVFFGELPLTWRLPLLIGYIGFDCLTRSLQLHLSTRFTAIILLFAVVAPVSIICSALNLSLDPVLLSLGPVAVLLAAWLTHRALTTNRAAYTRKPQRGPFGIEQPG